MTATHKRAPYGAVKEACSLADGMGLTAKDIARATGFPLSSIRSCCRDYGFAILRQRRMYGSIKSLVHAGYAKGMTVPQLAKSSGVSPYTIYSVARRIGIALHKARKAPLKP